MLQTATILDFLVNYTMNEARHCYCIEIEPIERSSSNQKGFGKNSNSHNLCKIMSSAGVVAMVLLIGPNVSQAAISGTKKVSSALTGVIIQNVMVEFQRLPLRQDIFFLPPIVQGVSGIPTVFAFGNVGGQIPVLVPVLKPIEVLVSNARLYSSYIRPFITFIQPSNLFMQGLGKVMMVSGGLSFLNRLRDIDAGQNENPRSWGEFLSETSSNSFNWVKKHPGQCIGIVALAGTTGLAVTYILKSNGHILVIDSLRKTIVGVTNDCEILKKLNGSLTESNEILKGVITTLDAANTNLEGTLEVYKTSISHIVTANQDAENFIDAQELVIVKVFSTVGRLKKQLARLCKELVIYRPN
jgi:hypothetical protein